jgi:hypothetical protein
MAIGNSQLGRALLAGACFVLLSILGARIAAAAPTLTLDAPACTERSAHLTLSVSELFDDETRLALESGLPTTLSFEWRLWRKRNGWWDDRIATGGVRYRIFYDLLEERYEAFEESGRRITGSRELSVLEETLCARHDLEIRSPIPLLDRHRYYIDVMARLQPLDSAEMQGLEDWLRGSGKAALRGISRGARKIFGSGAGLRSRSVVARSAVFNGAVP